MEKTLRHIMMNWTPDTEEEKEESKKRVKMLKDKNAGDLQIRVLRQIGLPGKESNSDLMKSILGDD